MRLFPILLCSLTAAAFVACGPQVVDPTPPTPAPDQQAPEFEGGGQEANIGASIYPGPYGIGIGSVIPNYRFFGHPRPNVDKANPRFLELADFYNPTGTDVYPPGSPYGEGTPKPKALLLDRSAVWCVPCQIEAEQHIPPRRAAYAPRGEFLVTLDDGSNPGVVATREELDYWVTRFDINYPAVIDPNSTLSAIVGEDAYPGNVIVRTKDMKVIDWAVGTPTSAFWQTFEAVMNDQPVLPGE